MSADQCHCLWRPKPHLDSTKLEALSSCGPSSTCKSCCARALGAWPAHSSDLCATSPTLSRILVPESFAIRRSASIDVFSTLRRQGHIYDSSRSLRQRDLDLSSH